MGDDQKVPYISFKLLYINDFHFSAHGLAGKEAEEGGAAAGHGGVKGAFVIELLLEGGKGGMCSEDRALEVIDKQIFPLGNIAPEDFLQGKLRYGGNDAAVGLGRRNGDAFRDHDPDPEPGEVEGKRFQDFAAAGAEHGRVVEEKGTVAAQAGGISGQLSDERPSPHNSLSI